ncbi:MAG TPA: type II secretion system protein GspM [Steroidobacteraceae bacterium]
MNVRAWLDNLQERERRLVYGAAGLAGLALLYLVLVLPFQTATHRAAQRLDRKQTDLTWMRQVAPQVSSAAGAAGAAHTGESLVVLVDRTAREAGLGTSLRDQSPDQNKALRLRLEAVQFDAMIAWLASLQTQYGVSIEAAAIDGTGPGLVNASLTLSHPAG